MAAGYHNLSSIDRHPAQNSSSLPKNTIVVMPKHPPASRSTLWVAFWGVGVAMGLILRTMIDGSGELPAERNAAAAIVQPGGPMPTLAVNVNAVLQLPTATPSPIPTVTVEAKTITPTINDCGSAQPGQICQVPYPPAPTATPYPSCLRLDSLQPGSWCMWPTESPTGHYAGTGQ
jgi:hypothetical protein